ncbi:MAG: hypothetical protein JJE39_05845 [Vicinamibacteria bacterium]|nr:hypothetical protein [Vicinamibacteria bacterium]
MGRHTYARSETTEPGSLFFGAAGGRTAFQNFLTGNRDGLCGSTCIYTEPTIEVASQMRFARYEFYVQDSWKVRSNVSIDLGLRYSLQPPVTDENDVLTNFRPALYDRAPTDHGEVPLSRPSRWLPS